MKRYALALVAALLPIMSNAAPIKNADCYSAKYHDYVDASINWYQALVDMTVKKDPTLDEVAAWFLKGRKNHFNLNAQAFDYYLENDSAKLNLEAPVESWLKLSQEDVKTLAQSSLPPSTLAEKVFNFRQGEAMDGNYTLRSALADLLSHPKEIDKALNQYNDQMNSINQRQCQ
ncbi:MULTISPECIES: hypothetical protein [Salinivibrio]|uniref:Uncharacterized protein n=1 Tax=Salinivibrio kushneri TaxID=1908198 RepID=A0AB36K7U6_9GAMM|nr:MULTISPECIES: hypothetical protein [Salinivibrio]ODP98810.1 hypothetical protein BGL48_10035 [Salinivibrio sp. BNH]OOE33015.1 hypothetical protein BZG05_12185 [Salinivibrio kushneri]OOE33992.1 hypothetical protein BZG04_12290 [Salinivibrio kushneri]OOE41475.1 hypothetical protein BZG00_00405 [Salinivibrio kushneri]OOE44734.1 hypothetical protein BZG09_06610 [Salinivibrio kushneri]